jgi:hypothetical protein
MFYLTPLSGTFRIAPDGNPAETDTVGDFVADLRKLDDEADRSQPMSYRDCKKVF